MFNLWHPFKKVSLEAVPKEEINIKSVSDNLNISDDIDRAQLRSLKARTEITMIYERLADNAIQNLKAKEHVSYY